MPHSESGLHLLRSSRPKPSVPTVLVISTAGGVQAALEHSQRPPARQQLGCHFRCDRCAWGVSAVQGPHCCKLYSCVAAAAAGVEVKSPDAGYSDQTKCIAEFLAQALFNFLSCAAVAAAGQMAVSSLSTTFLVRPLAWVAARWDKSAAYSNGLMPAGRPWVLTWSLCPCSSSSSAASAAATSTLSSLPPWLLPGSW